MRPISIGGQYFESIRTENCFYVDKTPLIKEWWESKDAVTLISRPRRFGKTLNINMLECFFSAKYAGRADLFEGLSIWQEEKYRELQGTYPVISLSFANVKANAFGGVWPRFKKIILELFRAHDYLHSSDRLGKDDKKYIRDYTRTLSFDNACDCLNILSEMLEKHFNKKVIILLDEYDTPMQEAWVSGYWDEMTDFIRGLFNSTFKTNPHLHRAFITGITRVSKESIFSDLNNLKVVTVTSDSYADCFGFTEEEVQSALLEAGIPEEMDMVRSWYDGFTFGNKSDIYNPWSITNFLKEKRYEAHWMNTSGNALPSTLIRNGSLEVKEDFAILLEGGTIEKEIDEQIIFNQLAHDDNAIWSLLLASGYLKAVSRTITPETGKQRYELKLTNKEVILIFRKLVRGWFTERGNNYGRFNKALLKGDLEDMNYYLQEVMDGVISSFDVGGKQKKSIEELAGELSKGEITLQEFLEAQKSLENAHNPEAFYHALMLGMLVELRDQYQVKSNRESGRGRYDVMLIPRELNNKDYPGIVMEFKLQDKNEKSLEETVKRALEQIDTKGYEAELRELGLKDGYIRKYGFGFKGKTVMVGE